MLKDRKILGLIPARKNSKGLPGKNISLIAGQPLIAWTIQSACKSKFLDSIIVTTDGEEIADIAKSYGAKVPFLRPAELASDSATSVDVALHAIKFFNQKQNLTFDYIVLLEPTSPIRKFDDIDNMILKLDQLKDRFDGIVSIGKIQEHPFFVKKKCNENLIPFYRDSMSQGRRQALPTPYFPFGVAYIVKTKTLLEEKSFYPVRQTYFEIDRFQCYEIDDYYDFYVTEKILEHTKDKL